MYSDGESDGRGSVSQQQKRTNIQAQAAIDPYAAGGGKQIDLIALEIELSYRLLPSTRRGEQGQLTGAIKMQDGTEADSLERAQIQLRLKSVVRTLASGQCTYISACNKGASGGVESQSLEAPFGLRLTLMYELLCVD